MEKISNYKSKFKKNTFFSIFNGYHETGIHASELHRKTYDSEKKIRYTIVSIFFFMKLQSEKRILIY